MTQNENPISRFPVPDINSLPDDLKETIVSIQEKTGFVPNVFLALAHRPEELRAFMAYHDALMERDSKLTKAEREMIVVATSGGNNCQYCVIAHGAILRIRERNPLIADQVAINYQKADLSERQKLMLEFAMMVSTDSGEVTDDDIQTMRDNGFSDEEIWDITGITAFFGMSNRMANVLSIRPNDEFYLMGRVPRDNR